jgi:hypothetical protein
MSNILLIIMKKEVIIGSRSLFLIVRPISIAPGRPREKTASVIRFFDCNRKVKIKQSNVTVSLGH